MKRVISLLTIVSILFLLSSSLFAGADFYEDTNANPEQRQKVVFDFGNGDEWKSVVDEVDGIDYGTKSSDDTWILKGGEGFVWKDNGSNITSVTLHYRIYKDGTTPPSFSDIDLPWNQDYSGTNNQRWASTAENIDILASVNSAGLWYVEFYYSGATNGVDCTNPIYFSNNSNNYKLHFTADQSLAIKLINFDVFKKPDNNIIKWTVSNQENVTGFLVERSSDATKWEKLGEVKKEGFFRNQINYSFTDENPLTEAYYRLKTINTDGIITISNVVYITRSGDRLKLNNLYPNPSNGNFSIDISSVNTGTKKIILVNSFGKIVFEKQISSKSRDIQEKIHANHLPEGIYILIIEQNNEVIQKRIEIIK